MSFRLICQKYLEPAAMIVMILGIIFLCQPWVEFLHVWSVLTIIIGLVTFLVVIHVPAPDSDSDGGQHHG